MKISRRSFLWISGAAITGSLAIKLGCSPKEPAVEPGKEATFEIEDLRIKYAETTTSICPICGVGCGVLVFTENGKIISVEGDPDHPINEGALCSKGAALFSMYYIYNEKGELVPNPQRITKVLYRAPKAKDWEVKDWDWALATIAERVKKTRDEYFQEKNKDGVTVNRCTALAWLGSAMCTNEENYLYQKFCRALGIVNVDHCARL